MSEMMKIREPA
jgi:hypothetical protein